MAESCMGRSEGRLTPTRKREILEAARAEFARAGYAGATVRSIGRSAGVHLPSIYHHFGDKENLFREVLFEAHGRLMQSVNERRVIDRGLPAEIESIFDAINEFHRREPESLYLSFALTYIAPPAVQADFAARSGRELFALLRDAFRRTGRGVDRVRLSLMNDVLRSFLLGLTAPAMRTGKPVRKQQAIRFILQGL